MAQFPVHSSDFHKRFSELVKGFVARQDINLPQLAEIIDLLIALSEGHLNVQELLERLLKLNLESEDKLHYIIQDVEQKKLDKLTDKQWSHTIKRLKKLLWLSVLQGALASYLIEEMREAELADYDDYFIQGDQLSTEELHKLYSKANSALAHDTAGKKDIKQIKVVVDTSKLIKIAYLELLLHNETISLKELYKELTHLHPKKEMLTHWSELYEENLAAQKRDNISIEFLEETDKVLLEESAFAILSLLAHLQEMSLAAVENLRHQYLSDNKLTEKELEAVCLEMAEMLRLLQH